MKNEDDKKAKKKQRGGALGVRQKFLVFFLLLVVLPVTVVLVIISQSYYRHALTGVIEKKYSLTNQGRKYIGTQLENYRKTTMMFYYNENIMSTLENAEFDFSTDEIYDYLSGFVNTEKHVINAVFLPLDGTMQSAGNRLLLEDEFYEKNLVDVFAAKGRPVLVPTQVVGTNYQPKYHVFGLARAINDKNGVVGSLWVFINTNFFEDVLLEPGLISDDTTAYIMDGHNIIASNNRELEGVRLEEPWLESIENEVEGHILWERGDQSLVITKAGVPDTSWVMVSATPLLTIQKSVQHIWKMSVAIFVIFVVFVLIMYLVMAKTLFEPIARLNKGMKRIGNGSFGYRVKETGRDELGELAARYNEMAQHIENLLEDVRQQEQEKNEETIKVLSMQIGSHFLYNTLNTIRWMAVINKQPQIREMVVSLTKLLMSVTYHTNEEITLRDELELVHHYGIIQKARYANFEIAYDVPEELQELYICKLVMQPVIENSVLHAFGSTERQGTITIKARCVQNDLQIIIADNGRGFDVNVIEWEAEPDKSPDHIGLLNVNRRLKLNYGEKYGVKIQSELDKGTQVQLYLPILTHKEKVAAEKAREEKQ